MPPILRDIAVAVCRELLDPGIDAGIIGNSTIDPAVNPDPEKGGYSGRPLFPKALKEVGGAAARLNGGLTLVGNGGIFDGHDAYTMMKQSGCPLVQVHSAFPYQGPTIARKMQQELLEAMDRHGMRHVSEIAGPTAGRPTAATFRTEAGPGCGTGWLRRCAAAGSLRCPRDRRWCG